MNAAYKPLGLLTILISWAALGFLVYNWRGDKTMSFSKHAASHARAFLMMAVVQTIVLPLFFAFIVFWFSPAYQLPGLYTVLAGLCSLGFLIAAWVPDNGGHSSVIHGVAAYGAALILVPATALISVSPYIATIPRFVSYLTLAYMLFAISWAVTVGGVRRYHLYLQATYILMFHLLIVMTTYMGA